MKDLQGKVAVITGGASGIGYATAELMTSRGMRVVIADIERAALDDAVERLRAGDADVVGVVTDVARWDDVQHLAEEALDAFGKVNVAFLNAGVAGGGGGRALWELDLEDWQWSVAVNVWGIVHGARALVPAIIDSGEEGHVVITSSSVGVIAPLPSGATYNMTKAAGCSLAETMHGDFRTRGLPISASVLVPPGTINTGLFTSQRNRHPEYTPANPRPPGPVLTYEEMLERMNKAGNPRQPVQPSEVAEYVVEAIERDTFWILPDDRHENMRDGFDRIIRARAESMLGRGDPMDYMQQQA